MSCAPSRRRCSRPGACGCSTPARDEEPRWRTVDPLGLVDAGGQWYLLGTRDGADRTYRLSRARAAEVLDEPAATAADVDVARLWEERRTRFREGLANLPVRIRVPAARRADLPSTLPVDAEEPDGHHVVLDVRFGGAEHAETVVWGLAPDAEVLAPPELRRAVARRALATARHHDRP